VALTSNNGFLCRENQARRRDFRDMAGGEDWIAASGGAFMTPRRCGCPGEPPRRTKTRGSHMWSSVNPHHHIHRYLAGESKVTLRCELRSALRKNRRWRGYVRDRRPTSTKLLTKPRRPRSSTFFWEPARGWPGLTASGDPVSCRPGIVRTMLAAQ
jgi:hypothetical protein